MSTEHPETPTTDIESYEVENSIKLVEPPDEQTCWIKSDLWIDLEDYHS